MRIIGLVVAGTLIAVVTAAATRLHDRRPRLSAEAGAGAEAEAAGWRQEVASLRSSQRMLAAAVLARNAAPSAAGARAPVPPAQRADSPEPPPSANLPATSEVVGHAYETEAQDPAWAADARARLVEVYGGKDFSGSHVAAECKTSLCQLTFAFDSRADGERIVSLVGRSNPWGGPWVGQFDPETSHGVFYLARSGRNLPLPDSPTLNQPTGGPR